ncbi:MAG: YceD family protein [Daejeonella sp.]
MKSLQQYSIPYTGLNLGVHQFEFEVSDTFFSEFEYSLVKSGTLKVKLDLEKQETMMIMHFHISGEMKLGCDVCLADYPYEVEIDERQIAKFTNNTDLEEDTEEIIVLTKNENEINVATLIYEYINLAVPYINRCGDEGKTGWCDQEMIEKLKQLSGVSNEESENADPRWEALKNIKK